MLQAVVCSSFISYSINYIKLLNIKGQSLISIEVNEGSTQESVNMSRINSGIYILQVLDSSGRLFSQTIIKN